MKVKVLRVKAEVSIVNGLKGQGRSQGSMVSRVKVESVKGQWPQESSAARYQAGWRVESLKVESLKGQWSQGQG